MGTQATSVSSPAGFTPNNARDCLTDKGSASASPTAALRDAQAAMKEIFGTRWQDVLSPKPDISALKPPVNPIMEYY